MTISHMNSSASSLSAYAAQTEDTVVGNKSIESVKHTEMALPDPLLMNSIKKLQVQDSLLSAPKVSADVSGTIDSTLSVLNGMTAGDASSDIFYLMQLMLRASQTQRGATRDIRQSESAAKINLQYDAAQKIRDGADKQLTGAIIAGATQIAGGVIAGAGAAISLHQSYSSTSQSQQGQEAKAFGDTVKENEWAASAAKTAANAKLASAGSEAGSAVVSATGKAIQAGFDSQAAKTNAEKAELDALVTQRDNIIQGSSESMQQQLDVIRDVLEKLRALDQSRHDVNGSIIRNL